MVLVGVGWQGRCQHAADFVSSTTKVHTVFVFCFVILVYTPEYIFQAVAATGGRVRSFVRVGEPLLRKRGMIGSCQGE